jgi:hypothetical protein
MKIADLALIGAIVTSTLSAAVAQQPTAPGVVTPPPAQPQLPQRTPPRAARPGEDPLKGTSLIRGFVVAADTGDPIRRAMVTVRSNDGRSGGVVSTNAEGRFEIKELLGGRYNISAQKAGYVSTSYGQRRAEQPGTPLEILEGQIVDKLTISMPRGGVITGKLLDEFGDPIAGAQVSALRHRFINGSRRLMPSGSGQSDDLGNYRIYGLSPGEYYVSAGQRSQAMMGMNMSPAGGNMSSNVEGYAPTYFPGTPNAAESQRVMVRVGREATDISFALTATRLVTVSGRAVSSTGEPYVQAFIMAQPADRYSGLGMGMGMGNAMTRPDGTFQMTGVSPGTYNLSMRPNNMGGARSDANTEFASMRIVVGQDDLNNVLLVSSRGAVARGVIATDDGSELPVKPPQIFLSAQAIDPDTAMMSFGQPKVNEDLTFEIPGLTESRLIRANIGGNPDWALKAIYHRDLDVTDTPIDFVPGRDVEGFEIIFTRKRTDLSGTVTNDRGEADTDATIVIFSADRERWTPMTRFVRTARPAQDGRYSLRGMPPHDYLVVAVRDVEPGQWQDPDFLESVRDQALRVSLGEGETKVQDLKVSR